MDTNKIFERSSHLDRKNTPLLNKTWLTTPQVFETFVLYNFWVKWISIKHLHTQSCKLSYYFGVYPIYKRNKVFLNIFIFLLSRLLSSICDILYVCCSDLGHIPDNTFPLVHYWWRFDSLLSFYKSTVFLLLPCACLTPHWQNLNELRILFKGCFLWVQV